MQATQKELNESIEALKNYRDRLRNEIIQMSQKLRISKAKTKIAIDENTELKNIDEILKSLTAQKIIDSN